MDDIRENGYDQRQPIWLIEDEGLWKILEGRNRFKACVLLGVMPTFEKFDPAVHGDPEKFVKRMNAFRRHEKRSEMLAWVASLANKDKGRPESNGPNEPFDSPVQESLTIAEAATKAGVGRSTVKRQKKVSEKADPMLKEAVAAGTIKVSDAANIADKPPQVQQAAVEAVKDGKAKTVTGAVENLHLGDAKTKKSGQIKFNDKTVDDLIGKLVRSFDDRANAVNDKGPLHDKCLARFRSSVFASRLSWTSKA